MESLLTEILRPWRLEARKQDGDWYHDLSSGDTERWKSVSFLGSGTFGNVSLEQCIPGSSSPSTTVRAVKQISKRQAHLYQSSRRELEALVTFSDTSQPHYQRHFVRFLGWFEDDADLYIAMEFIQHGNLQQYIDQGIFPEPEAASVTAQVAQALQYMHQKRFVHRDLKPMNILVSKPGPEWHVKVADFGISKQTDGTAAATHNIGTPGYMAPELLGSADYTAAVDVWALGAVAYCMRTGFPPFRSILELCNYQRDLTQFPSRELGRSSGFCMNFVLRTMEDQPERRLTIEQVLVHDWLTIDMEQTQSTMDVRPRVATAPDSTWGIVPKDAWADTYNPASTVQQGSLPYHTRQQQTALPLSSLSSQNPPPPEMPRPDTTSSSSSSTEDEKADRKPRTPAEKENEYIPKHFFRNYRKIASNSVYRTAKVSTPEPSDPLPGSRTASVDLPPRDTETPARAFPRRQEELAEKESITPDSVLKRQQRPNRGLSSRGPGSTESGTSPSTSSVSLPVANGPYFSAQAEGTELMSGVADQARDSYEYVMKPPSYKLGRDGKRRSAPPQGPAQVSSHSVFPLGLMGLTRGRVRDEKSSLEPIVTNSAINASSIETPKRFFDFSGGDPIKSHKPGRNNERSHRRRHLTPEEQAAMDKRKERRRALREAERGSEPR